MKNKKNFIFFISLFNISSIYANEPQKIENVIKLDKNISNNDTLFNYMANLNGEFYKYHQEFKLYSKNYIFSSPEHLKIKKMVSKLEKSFNISKFNLLNKLIYKDEYILNKLNILLNEYKVILEYYKEYSLLCKLKIDKDIEIQRSIIIKNINSKYLLIDTYSQNIKFYTENIKKNIVDDKKVDHSIVENNKRIYQSELDMLLHNLLKTHKRKDIFIDIKEHEKNLKIINKLLKININTNVNDCLININNSISELYENYVEYNKIKLEKNNQSELKFILSNIDINFNITYEYIDKCKGLISE